MNRLDLSHIPERHRKRLRQIPKRFDKKWDGHLGEINVISHHISLKPNARAFKQRRYRIGPKTREFIAEEVEGMSKAQAIKPATAE